VGGERHDVIVGDVAEGEVDPAGAEAGDRGRAVEGVLVVDALDAMEEVILTARSENAQYRDTTYSRSTRQYCSKAWIAFLSPSEQARARYRSWLIRVSGGWLDRELGLRSGIG
jgi:hypothetical protein